MGSQQAVPGAGAIRNKQGPVQANGSPVKAVNPLEETRAFYPIELTGEPLDMAIRKNLAGWGSAFMLSKPDFSRFMIAGHKATSGFSEPAQHDSFVFIIDKIYHAADSVETGKAFYERGATLGTFVSAIENPKFMPHMVSTFREIFESYKLDIRAMASIFTTFNRYLDSWKPSLLTEQVVKLEKSAWSLSEIAKVIEKESLTIRCNEPARAFQARLEIRSRIAALMRTLKAIHEGI